MISSRIFQKHYLITAIIILFFIVLGILSNIFIMRFSERDEPKMKSPTSIFFARVMDYLDQGNPANALAKLEALNEHSLSFVFTIYDERGDIVSGKEPMIVPDWARLKKPVLPYESVHVGDVFKPGSGPRPPFFGGPPPRGQSCELIRLKSNPAVFYLYACIDRSGPQPAFNMFLLSFGVLLFSILIGAGVSLLFLFNSFGKKAKLLDGVISELQRGNLKARVPISRMDEVGQAMSRFNQMAEELERLVEHMKGVEQSRVLLLQELTHDLRTPVASLKNLLETLNTGFSQMDEKIRREFLTLTLSEVDYFERLIEDLLILAQVSEPRYHAGREPVLLDEILEEESETIHGKSLSEKKNVSLKSEIEVSNLAFLGDKILLKRLFRNALENAFSFADHEIVVSLKKKDAAIEICIDDDGPGFGEKALQNFGVRRQTRELGTQRNGRLSVGLGSVIMKTVAEVHQGSIQASNRLDLSGNRIGGRITIRFPLDENVSGSN